MSEDPRLIQVMRVMNKLLGLALLSLDSGLPVGVWHLCYHSMEALLVACQMLWGKGRNGKERGGEEVL